MRRRARETSPEVSTSRAVATVSASVRAFWFYGLSWLDSGHHRTSFPASQDGG